MKKRITSQLIVALLCLLPIVGMAQDLPDLIISNLEIIDPISPNYDISYQYEITNVGNAPAILDDIDSSIAIRILSYISDSQAFNPDTGILVENNILDASVVEVGETITQTFGAAVNFNITETPYLTMKVDAGEDLDEAKEDNNTRSVLIPAQPSNDSLPDLIIYNLKVIDPISPNYDISYEYQITNIGNKIANLEGLSIQAFISEDQIFSPDIDIAAGGRILGASQLGVNETITQTFGGTVNFDTEETPYLVMKVDWNEILEESNEQNNVQFAFINPPDPNPVNEASVKKQFIINLDALDAALADSIVDIFESFGGYPVAACNQCGTNIQLWEFDDESDIDSILSTEIDIDGGTISAEEIVDKDSDPNQLIDLALGRKMKGYNVSFDNAVKEYQREIVVYLLDSGLSTEHFGQNEWDYLIPDAPYCDTLKSQGYNYMQPPAISTDYGDDDGHGTFGFYAITRDLPDNVKVVPLKIFDGNGKGTLFSLVCAMYHAVNHGADIINISAGYIGEPSSLLTNAVEVADKEDIWIVAATGNDCKSIDIDDALQTSQYPAAYASTGFENVISVASLNPKTDKLARSSNYGSNTVTLAAYGDQICGNSNKKYPVLNSGTSMAAFHVTRALAVEMATNASADITLQEFVSNQTNGVTTETKMPDKPVLDMRADPPKLKLKYLILNFLRSIGIGR